MRFSLMIGFFVFLLQWAWMQEPVLFYAARADQAIVEVMVGDQGICWIETTSKEKRREYNILGKDCTIAVQAYSWSDAQPKSVFSKSGKGMIVKEDSVKCTELGLTFVYFDQLSMQRPRTVCVAESNGNWEASWARKLSFADDMPQSTIAISAQEKTIFLPSGSGFQRSMVLTSANQMSLQMEHTLGLNRLQLECSKVKLPHPHGPKVIAQILAGNAKTWITNPDQSIYCLNMRHSLLAIHEPTWDTRFLKIVKTKAELHTQGFLARKELQDQLLAIQYCHWLHGLAEISKTDTIQKDQFQTIAADLGKKLRACVTLPVENEDFVCVVSYWENKAYHLPKFMRWALPDQGKATLWTVPNGQSMLYLVVPLQDFDLSADKQRWLKAWLKEKYAIQAEVEAGFKPVKKIKFANLPAATSSAKLQVIQSADQLVCLVRCETSEWSLLKQLLNQGLPVILEWDSASLGFSNVELLQVQGTLKITDQQIQEMRIGEQYEICLEVPASFWAKHPQTSMNTEWVYQNTTQKIQLNPQQQQYKISFMLQYDFQGQPVYRFTYRLENTVEWQEDQVPFVILE